MNNNSVQRVRAIIERHLNDIAPLFVAGMRVTFIARNPASDEQDMVITADDLSEVAKVIDRRKV